MVTIQNYVRAQSIDEAYELNQKKGKLYYRRNALDKNAGSPDTDSHRYV